MTWEPESLRKAMVDQIITQQDQLGQTLPPAVEMALRRVPRHLFAPGVELEAAYADDALVTKTSEDGINLSSVSAPNLIASMLGQLEAEPGMRVLEIGSGGYNAALLAQLVGPEGAVTTMDIDPEVIDRARACLDAAGYSHVRTVCADGEFGVSDDAPFDRIIVTVGAWDIPPAWSAQLATDGRLVVPLRMRGLTRSWALEHAGGHLASHSHLMCGFVPMQGAGQNHRHTVALHGAEVTLWADEGLPVAAAALDGVLSRPRVETWSGITRRRGQAFSDQDLWLATTMPGACQLAAQHGAVERGLIAPSWRLGTPALLAEASLAYRAKLRLVDAEQELYEFGAYAHGPEADTLAERLVDGIRSWDRQLDQGCGPRLTVHPAATPNTELPEGCIVDKRHTRIVLSWPNRTS